MAITILFGVNGVGKDALAAEVQRADPSLAIISGSRVLMKALGMDVQITADFPVPFSYYQRLDALDLKTANAIYEDQFAEIIRDCKRTGPNALLLSHLSILKVDPVTGRRSFDDDFIREWFYELFDRFVLVKADANTIKSRNDKDSQAGIRTRNSLSVMETQDQIDRSDRQWQKLTAELLARNKHTYHEIDNSGQLGTARDHLLTVLRY